MTDNNFVVPQPKSESMLTKKLPCPFSPAGMLQPSHLQPPPMFGPRGPTIPPKHLAPYAHFKINRSQPRATTNHGKYNRQKRSNDSNTRFYNKFQNNNQSRSSQRQQRSREFWCEPCDRDFSSQDLLVEHKGQHQRCGIDGCNFQAHEIIVTKHIQMQHSTGLYERLKNLQTPEDILKWREERKKRYPTKANIELRQQMQEERNKRGEKLNNSTARFGRNSDRKRCSNKSTNQSHIEDKKKEGKKKRQRPNKKIVVEVKQPENVNDNEESDSNNGLPKFKGTSQMKDYKKRKEVQAKNALSGLLGMYTSDSDSSEDYSDDTQSSEEVEKETIVSKTDQTSDSDSVQESLESVPKSHISANDIKQNLDMENSMDEELSQNDPEDLPSEEPILKQNDFIESVTPTKQLNVPQKRNTKAFLKAMPIDKRISKRPTIMNLSKKYRNQNTMLEKLLQNEIRHERNVLLQCVRHVVKEKFFGIGQKPL